MAVTLKLITTLPNIILDIIKVWGSRNIIYFTQLE